MHIQRIIIFLQVGNGNIQDMIPDGPVSGIAVLQPMGRFMSLLRKGRIGFAFAGGAGIDLFQFRNGKWRFLRIAAVKGLVEIRKIRLPFLQFRDNLSHLQSPVSQMHIPDGFVTQISADPFQALADDGGSQMSDMKRLCHIGSAVINDDLFRRGSILKAELVCMIHPVHITGQLGPGNLQIDKSGFHCTDFGKPGVLLQLSRHLFRDHDRRFPGGFGQGHGGIALKFTQIRPVGNRSRDPRSVISFRFKCLFQLS